MKSNCAGINYAATVVGQVIGCCTVKAFALLDSCSQGKFGTEWILKKLHVTSVETLINIKALNGNQKVSSTLVDGKMVLKQVLNAKDQIHWLKLPGDPS